MSSPSDWANTMAKTPITQRPDAHWPFSDAIITALNGVDQRHPGLGMILSWLVANTTPADDVATVFRVFGHPVAAESVKAWRRRNALAALTADQWVEVGESATW